MTDRYRLTRLGKTWHVMARKNARAATAAACVSLGGCRSQIISVRLWLALFAGKVRK